ncbi:MAG TPA: hypothetical protein VGP15_22375 [Burkholderiales bacterium]|nr:hypothetical protein [Burkholderiales bacterium]
MSVRYRGVVGETGHDRVYGKYFDRNGTQRDGTNSSTRPDAGHS